MAIALEIKGWLTNAQAAEKMGVNPWYLRRLVQIGALPEPVRVNAVCIMHREDDILAYIRDHPRLGLKFKQPKI